MAEFWSNYGLPIALIIGQSLLLLVTLLIVVAFLLYADRKVWVAVQMRRGPNVVGPFGQNRKGALWARDRGFLPHQSDRARLGNHGKSKRPACWRK